MKIRINKYLAGLGVASRRNVDELIKAGNIKINNRKAELGSLIDPETDEIKVNNNLIEQNNPSKEYIILNKPKDITSTVSDEKGRKTVLDLVDSKNRLYPVGRLDRDSTGLILLTNDGDLALKMTHPRYHVPKTYVVKTRETLKNIQLKLLSKGIRLDGIVTLPAIVNKLDNTTFEITIFQGMKRQIRRMCGEVGLTIISLHRTKIGDINIGNLKSGEYRHLTSKEFEYLESITKSTNSL